MPGPRLEAAINAMAMRARLYERMAHDRGPWAAVVHSAGPPGAVFFTSLMHPMALERTVCGDRVVLSGYLSTPVSGVTAVDIWCRGQLMTSWPSSSDGGGPVRIVLAVTAEDAELAA